MQKVTIEELTNLISEEEMLNHLTSDWREVIRKKEYPETTIGSCWELASWVTTLLFYELGISAEEVRINQGGEYAPHYIVEIPGRFFIDAALSQDEWEVLKGKRNIPNIIIQEITPEESLLAKACLKYKRRLPRWKDTWWKNYHGLVRR